MCFVEMSWSGEIYAAFTVCYAIIRMKDLYAIFTLADCAEGSPLRICDDELIT